MLGPSEDIKIRQHPPMALTLKPLTMREVEDYLKHCQNKSAPGPNGVRYVVYKRCHQLRAYLLQLLWQAWQTRTINTYLTRHYYINTVIPKCGAKHMSGCIEHTAAIWDTIKESRKARRNVSVVWLDLANAYGAVPNPLISKALKAFHVNQGIIEKLQ